MEKIMIACCEIYLEDSGVKENDLYGPGNVKNVMNGKNYVRGLRCMTIWL